MKNQYDVITGNIGTTYTGTNGFLAIKEYNECVVMSKSRFGRASGEDVTLFKNGEPYREFIGALSEDDQCQN